MQVLEALPGMEETERLVFVQMSFFMVDKLMPFLKSSKAREVLGYKYRFIKT